MTDHEAVEDPVAFWDERHANLDPWRAGGDRGLSPEENYEFYAFRLGRLIELIRRHGDGERPLRILDAGCGRGHLTHGFHKCGHHALGIDSSATAIEWARENYGPMFGECLLDAYRPPMVFDVVLCIDVLFHVLDDDEWRAALRALARYAAAESILIITGTFPDERYWLHDYIVHRTAEEHDAVLRELDFAVVERTPYAFGSNQNQFAVYRRIP